MARPTAATELQITSKVTSDSAAREWNSDERSLDPPPIKKTSEAPPPDDIFEDMRSWSEILKDITVTTQQRLDDAAGYGTDLPEFTDRVLDDYFRDWWEESPSLTENQCPDESDDQGYDGEVDEEVTCVKGTDPPPSNKFMYT